MFGKKFASSNRQNKSYDCQSKSYDKENLEPVLRCSICTGERTAGFRDIRSGKFTGAVLISSDEELRAFMEEYGLESIKKIY